MNRKKHAQALILVLNDNFPVDYNSILRWNVTINQAKERKKKKTNSYAVTLGRWYRVLERNPVALLSVNHSFFQFHLVLSRFRFIKRMFSWFYLIKKTFFRILWHIITGLWFLGSIICHFLLFIALNK